MSRFFVRFRTVRQPPVSDPSRSPLRGRHQVEWRQKSIAGWWFIPKVGREDRMFFHWWSSCCDSNLSCWNRNEYFFSDFRDTQYICHIYIHTYIHIYIYIELYICWVHKSGITWHHTFLHSFRDHSSCGVTRRRSSHLVASWSQDVTGCHWRFAIHSYDPSQHNA